MDRSSEVAPETDEVSESHNALVHLHSKAGAFGDLDPGEHPGFKPVSTKSALQTVADSPFDEIRESARLAILHDLIRADPSIRDDAPEELHAVAKSVADAHGLDAGKLLDDIATSAMEEKPLSSTQSGRQMKPHLTAFIGEDICQVGKVQVDGIDATWIFSEFETNAPFDHLASWVDPHNWPKFGPLLFKKMAPVGGRGTIPIDELGSEHWHGVFHEEVQLLRRVDTLLHCDFWRNHGISAGMTYEFKDSLDQVINVDRGFLLVNDVGGVRRVKALKIVGFTDDMWDWVARFACPFWTDFVRAAVEDGTTNTPGPGDEMPAGDSPTDLAGDLFAAWMEFFGESGKAYLDLFGDTFTRVTGGGYTTADWLEDGTKTWSQLAKDWAKAWSYGLDLVDEVREQGLDASFMPPDKKATDPQSGTGMAKALATTGSTAASTTAANSTLIPVPGLPDGVTPECSQLVSIEAGGQVIPPEALAITLEKLPDGKTPGVRISTGPNVTPGLYVGSLRVPQVKDPVPAQIYVAGVRRQSGN